MDIFDESKKYINPFINTALFPENSTNNLLPNTGKNNLLLQNLSPYPSNSPFKIDMDNFNKYIPYQIMSLNNLNNNPLNGSISKRDILSSEVRPSLNISIFDNSSNLLTHNSLVPNVNYASISKLLSSMLKQPKLDIQIPTFNLDIQIPPFNFLERNNSSIKLHTEHPLDTGLSPFNDFSSPQIVIEHLISLCNNPRYPKELKEAAILLKNLIEGKTTLRAAEYAYLAIKNAISLGQINQLKHYKTRSRAFDKIKPFICNKLGITLIKNAQRECKNLKNNRKESDFVDQVYMTEKELDFIIKLQSPLSAQTSHL